MLCLIPMAAISFYFLDLTSEVTGGLINNLENAVTSIGQQFGMGAFFLTIIAGMFLGLILIFLFPLHWAMFYRPDDIGLMFALIVPWILCCAITSGLFAKSPSAGIHTSIAIGLGYMIPAVIIYFALPFVLGQIIPGGSGIITAVIDGVSTGLTDLPFIFAVVTAIGEGCLVGAVFGGFIGSLRYNPEEEEKEKEFSYE
jgi:ABC-type multidrug transport system fused ATPase/permease subunit